MIFSKTKKAQGTIEYLVILAVVVVISLVIVGMFTGMFSSPSQQIITSSSNISNVTSGGISVVESVIDVQGDSLIKLSNNSSDTITLTRVSVGGVDNNFSEQLVGLDSKIFSLSSLNSNCPCEEGQKNVKCEFRIDYTTVSGISKTEYRTISAQCVSDSVPVNLDVVVEPIVAITDCFDALEDPIPICTLSDLNRVREDLTANYILMNDIDASETISWNNGAGFESIGNNNDGPFTGTIDGDSYSITGLIINFNLEDVGLIGFGGGMSASNIIFVDSNVSGGNNTGTLCGKCFESTISNIEVDGELSGPNIIGGVAGLFSGTMENVTVDIDISHFEGIEVAGAIGGIVGELYGGTILNSSSAGTIEGESNLGGIVGINQDSGEVGIDYCSSTITINGYGSSGGIVGQNSGILQNSYFTGSIDVYDGAGGIVGSNYGGYIKKSFSSGTISGDQGGIGGIVGYNYGYIENSYFSGVLTVPDQMGYSGGIVGSNALNITNSYSVGTINSSGNVGGLIGYDTAGVGEGVDEGFLSNSFSNIQINGQYANGAIGYTEGLLNISNIYWDTYLVGHSNCYNDTNTNCTSTNNQASSYYSASGIPFANLNWSTDIWTASDNNYPILSWQN